MSLRELSRLIEPKAEPQTTPSLSPSIERGNAEACVSEYYMTPSLREHLKKVFERVVHHKGQGFWVQAEYGAGKTHFLAVLINLLMWCVQGVWKSLLDDELKKEYEGPLSKGAHVSGGILTARSRRRRRQRQSDADLRGADSGKSRSA